MPSVVFSATVSTVAATISSEDSDAVSLPTMRPTCFLPASRLCSSAFCTPFASFARLLEARQVQEMIVIAARSTYVPPNAVARSTAAVTAMDKSTVLAVIQTEPRRSFALSPAAFARIFLSQKLIHLPIQITG